MIELAITDELLDAIRAVVDSVAVEYAQQPGLILTEDDLKCLLFSRFSSNRLLAGFFSTRDTHVKATRVHSEISWYDAKGKLTIKPDLTILDPAELRILKGDARRATLPSKGFGFSGDAIVFELKFIRQKSGITKSVYQRQILKDWAKVERLLKKLKNQNASHQFFCFFIIFNKGDRACSEFRHFLRRNADGKKHRILYRCGGVFEKS